MNCRRYFALLILVATNNDLDVRSAVQFHDPIEIPIPS